MKKKITNHIISYSCIYFTAIALLILIVQALSANENEVSFMAPSRFLMLYPFTLAVAVADCIFMVKEMKTFSKVLIHYASFAISFYIFVCSPIKNGSNPIAMVAIVSVLYFIVATPILIVASSKSKKKRESVPYQSVYKKK